MPVSSAPTPAAARAAWPSAGFWPLLGLLAALLWVAAPARVSGDSMFPTLHSGDLLLLEKYHRLRGDVPQRGDIVVFTGPPGTPYHERHWQVLGLRWTTQTPSIKRVVALPGETVDIAGGRLRVGGVPLAETYVTDGFMEDLPPRTLGPGELWVMGDNRQLGSSLDSRTYGPVRRQDVSGLVHWRLWPRPGRIAHSAKR